MYNFFVVSNDLMKLHPLYKYVLIENILHNNFTKQELSAIYSIESIPKDEWKDYNK